MGHPMRLELTRVGLLVHLSGVYHHIRRQDQQGSRKQTGQSKQTLQKCMEQQASEEGH